MELYIKQADGSFVEIGAAKKGFESIWVTPAVKDSDKTELHFYTKNDDDYRHLKSFSLAKDEYRIDIVQDSLGNNIFLFNSNNEDCGFFSWDNEEMLSSSSGESDLEDFDLPSDESETQDEASDFDLEGFDLEDFSPQTTEEEFQSENLDFLSEEFPEISSESDSDFNELESKLDEIEVASQPEESDLDFVDFEDFGVSPSENENGFDFEEVSSQPEDNAVVDLFASMRESVSDFSSDFDAEQELESPEEAEEAETAPLDFSQDFTDGLPDETSEENSEYQFIAKEETLAQLADEDDDIEVYPKNKKEKKRRVKEKKVRRRRNINYYKIGVVLFILMVGASLIAFLVVKNLI